MLCDNSLSTSFILHPASISATVMDVLKGCRFYSNFQPALELQPARHFFNDSPISEVSFLRQHKASSIDKTSYFLFSFSYSLLFLLSFCLLTVLSFSIAFLFSSVCNCCIFESSCFPLIYKQYSPLYLFIHRELFVPFKSVSFQNPFFACPRVVLPHIESLTSRSVDLR